MSFQRNEDTANMFRTRKPTVARTRHEKPSHCSAPDLHPYVPNAIVPAHATKKESSSNRTPAPIAFESVRNEEEGPLDGQAREEWHLQRKSHPQQQPPTQSIDAVKKWQRKLDYKPFLSDDDEEDLYREVPPECRIQLGHDPLINEVLAMFPEDGRTDS